MSPLLTVLLAALLHHAPADHPAPIAYVAPILTWENA